MCLNICLFASLPLPPGRHGTDIRSHCDAKRVRGSFFFPLLFPNYQKKKERKRNAYFSFELNSLANICQAQTLSNPHLFMFTKPKPLATANTQRSASHQHRYAQEHFHANEQKYSNSYRTCGLLTHTLSLSPGSVFPLLPSLSRLTNADRAFIHAPMHTACQTCTL